MSSNLGDVIGLFGVAVYLASYLVLLLGLISGQSMIYLPSGQTDIEID